MDKYCLQWSYLGRKKDWRLEEWQQELGVKLPDNLEYFLPCSWFARHVDRILSGPGLGSLQDWILLVIEAQDLHKEQHEQYPIVFWLFDANEKLIITNKQQQQLSLFGE